MGSAASATTAGNPGVERWLTKKEAATTLGLSTRAVERLAAANGIQMRHERPGPGRRYSMVLYSASAIDELKKDRAAGVRTASVSLQRTTAAPPPEAQLSIVRAQVGMFEGLAGYLTQLTPHVAKAWLTFNEAVEYSGLAPAMLAQVLDAGTVFGLGRGRKTWRIQRASLDAWSVEAKQ